MCTSGTSVAGIARIPTDAHDAMREVRVFRMRGFRASGLPRSFGDPFCLSHQARPIIYIYQPNGAFAKLTEFALRRHTGRMVGADVEDMVFTTVTPIWLPVFVSQPQAPRFPESLHS